MSDLCLVDNKNIVVSAGDNSKVIKELMNIIADTKAIPEVSYDSIKDCTKLDFEGYYNNFTLWLK
ncbi:MAG TPA: hypothetical protein GXZ90_09810 [Clostridiales bacterium]|nr:hypothetical protein [Clostridiales bacterium]